MAALPTTNISTTLVRNTLGEDNNDVGLLCKSPNINMFSKKKPVRDSRNFLEYADVGTGDNYGLVVPDWNGGNQVWTYNKPRGGSFSEPFRLGDFRGYQHEANIPVILNNYVGYVHNPEYTPQLSIIGLIPSPGSDNIGLIDILPNYYFAVQLTNDNSTVVWGTNSVAGEGGITIDFTQAPFNGSLDWLDSDIELKFFMSSEPKGFNDDEPVPLTKKAIHYDSTNAITTQNLTILSDDFIEVLIDGIRKDKESGVWLEPDGPYDPLRPPTPMITPNEIALRVKFKNNGPGEFTLYDDRFTFGTPATYYKVSRYTYVRNGMYNYSTGVAMSSITLPVGEWSDYVILYDSQMMSYGGTNPASGKEKYASFNVRMELEVLGEMRIISTGRDLFGNVVAFNKMVASE